jgi:hypothetical protein
MTSPHSKKLALLLLIGLVIGSVVVWRSHSLKTHELSPTRSSIPREEKRLDQNGPNAVDSKSGNSDKRNTQNRELPESLSIDSAKKLKEDFFLRVTDINERGMFCSMLITKLCKNGFSEEAWEMIEEGYGNVRSSELSTYFSQADLPANILISKLATMDLLGDVSTSFSGLLLRYSPEHLGEVLSSPEMKSLLEKFKENPQVLNISGALAGSIQVSMLESNEGDLNRILEVASKLNSDGLLDSNDFMNIVTSSRIENVFDQWQIIKSIENTTKWESDFTRKRSELISRMIESNSSLAISQIIEDSGVQKSHDLELAISAWTNIDSNGAAEWFKLNQLNLGSEDRSMVASAFASEAMNSLEFAGARLWAEQIQDNTVRASTLETINKKLAEYEMTKGVSK